MEHYTPDPIEKGAIKFAKCPTNKVSKCPPCFNDKCKSPTGICCDNVNSANNQHNFKYKKCDGTYNYDAFSAIKHFCGANCSPTAYVRNAQKFAGNDFNVYNPQSWPCSKIILNLNAI